MGQAPSEAPAEELTQPPEGSPTDDGKEASIDGAVQGFCCPKFPNLTKLVKAGKVRQVPDRDSPTGMKDWGREGDVFIRFVNGYWVGGKGEDDDVRIAWCKEEAAKDNPSVMNLKGPQAKVWYELVRGQQVTGRRDPTVPKSVNVARALRGDEMLGFGTDDFDAVLQTVEAANQQQG